VWVRRMTSGGDGAGDSLGGDGAGGSLDPLSRMIMFVTPGEDVYVFSLVQFSSVSQF
jgi:hypothetical protein